MFTSKDWFDKIRDTLKRRDETGVATSLQHKFGAHERIFKIILNLTTLFLTGWVALVLAFRDYDPSIFKVCAFHIATLFMVTVSDLFVMNQSRVGETIFYGRMDKWFNKLIAIDGHLVKLSSDPVIAPLPRVIADEAAQKLGEADKEISESFKDTVRQHIWFGRLSWITGYIAIIMFFVSIGLSVDTMFKYVARQPKDSPKNSINVEASPKPEKVKN